MAFLSVDSVDAIYDLWLTGNDITMETHSSYSHIKNPTERMLHILQARYQLGALKDFVIFIGRIGSTDARLDPKSLEQLCAQQAVHSCNSRHFVKESHWNRPTVFVTDCPRGARVDAARQQGLPVVHPKWILDCHTRNALLDFAYYLLEDNESSEFDSIGAGSCLCWDELLKLRHIAPEQAERGETRFSQRTVLDKFASHGDRLWNSVMHKTKKPSLTDVLKVSRTEPATEHASLFQDKHCYLLNFPAKHHAILRNIITRNGGICHDYNSGEQVIQPSYLVVPSTTIMSNLATQAKAFTHVVTEFFFERCLHYKKFLTPDPWCVPFFTNFQLVPSSHLRRDPHVSQSLNVAITGFQGVELLHITKILEYLKPAGLNLSPTLSKETEILVINLGALSSIPGDHVLWNNQYASMFEESRKLEQNQVHRNSMKRKIEFIKQKHSIPVVTAGFILELFARITKAEARGKPVAKIFLNDINWCISCPKGNKDHYYCELRKPVAEVQVTNSMPGPETTSVAQALKQNRQEALSKFSTRSLPTKRPWNGEVTYSSPNVNSTPQASPTKIARLVPTETLKPIQRTSSWGNALSNQAQEAKNQLDSDSGSSTQDEESIHTQVTYGSPQHKSEAPAPTRRLTRQQMKEINT